MSSQLAFLNEFKSGLSVDIPLTIASEQTSTVVAYKLLSLKSNKYPTGISCVRGEAQEKDIKRMFGQSKLDRPYYFSVQINDEPKKKVPNQ